MIIEMIKLPGGILSPASDMELEKLNKFKSDGQYSVEIKMVRNPGYHRKVFKFFTFVFDYWKGNNEFQSESKQFDVFRKELTVLAGFYDSFYNIRGELRVEAKSLSYSSMKQEEYEQCYVAITNAAMKHIFKATDDQNIYNQLISFF
jgi:hypothetical protein